MRKSVMSILYVFSDSWLAIVNHISFIFVAFCIVVIHIFLIEGCVRPTHHAQHSVGCLSRHIGISLYTRAS